MDRCHKCKTSLSGGQCVVREEHPYCMKCYKKHLAHTCEECKTTIGTDCRDLSYNGKHWHDKCFKCCDCTNSLVDKAFSSKNEKIYCSDCYDKNFADKCDLCGNIFKDGMKRYEYNGKQYHNECFCCGVCKKPVGETSFHPRDQEAVCVSCYEEKFADRCMACNGAINEKGIIHNGTPYHKDCFTCTNCKKVLAGEKFTSLEEKSYCQGCYVAVFTKTCIKCSKPISGFGGLVKFVSFDDKHWHSECFKCYKCSKSLVGRGFHNASDGGPGVLCDGCGPA